MKKSAFTLAEVLITLGIIGVVAALTLPSLIENHNKKVWTTALQKDYSVLNQGFSKMLADEGVSQLDDTSLFQSMNTTSCYPGYAIYNNCSDFFNGLNKYFNFSIIHKQYKIYWLRGTVDGDYGEIYSLIFPDGSMIFTYGTGMFYKNHQTNKNMFSSTQITESQISSNGGHMFSHQGVFLLM